MLSRPIAWCALVSLLAAALAVQPGVAAARQAESDQIEIGRVAGAVSRQLLRGETADPHTACTSEFSRSDRIGQTLLPGIVWENLADLGPAVDEGLVAGFAILGAPDASVGPIVLDLHARARLGLIAAVDEEGGRVQRLRRAIGPLASAQEQAQTSTPDELTELIAAHGRRMTDLGFSMVFGPVLDVGGGPGIGDRAYGSDPATVTTFGGAVAEGFDQADLVTVAKHFPGHGRASADSHLELPSTPSIEELEALDLRPFVDAIAAGVPAVMVGHLDVPGLTDGVPTSLSPEAVTGLLRGELGFEGLVLSDAMNMAAITDRWTTPEAVVLALEAGIDLVILGDPSELDAIHAFVDAATEAGRLSDGRLTSAAARVLATKDVHACVEISRTR